MAVGVAAQQHGLVVLDDAGEVVRPALFWNDERSAPDTTELIDELGGPNVWVTEVGSVPAPSFTVTKLRWLQRNEADAAERVATVLLPHDWVTWRLTGAVLGDEVTDRRRRVRDRLLVTL
jgi:xylulokinase